MIIKLLIHANCTLGKTALDFVMQANKAYSVFCLIKCGSVLQAKQGNLEILFLFSLMLAHKYWIFSLINLPTRDDWLFKCSWCQMTFSPKKEKYNFPKP